MDYLTEIPEVGDLWPLAALATKHPDYVANLPKWTLCREADELTGGFAPVIETYSAGDVPVSSESYLVPHSREDSDDYQRRVATARPPRFVPMGISSMVGSLVGAEVLRTNYPAKLSKWLSNCTPDSTTWATYLGTKVLPLLERYGDVYLWAHRPPVTARTEADLKSAGVPEVLLDVISPENFQAWERDELDDLVWCRWVEWVVNLPTPDGLTYWEGNRHHYATRLGWWTVDEVQIDDPADPKGAPMARVRESGLWEDGDPLGYVPLIHWQVRPHPTYAAALASRDYYATESEMRHLEASTAFSQLWVPANQSLESVKQVVKGANVIGKFDPEARLGPMMLSPDPGPFAHYMLRLSQLEADALACYGLQDGGASSGVALAHLEHLAQVQLRSHATACESAEYATMAIVADLLGETMADDSRARWPMEFGTLTATSQLADATVLMDMAPGKPVEAAVIEKAISIVLPGLPQKTRDELIKSLAERKDPLPEPDPFGDRVPVDDGEDDEDMAPAPPQAAGGKGGTLDPKAMREVKGQ